MAAVPKPEPKAKRRGHADPVTPEVYAEVMTRDGGCIVPLIDRDADVCRTRYGQLLTGRGRLSPAHLEWAHVPERGQNGLGQRAPSDARHGVILCAHHHHNGWENARGRDLERDYLLEQYPDMAPEPSQDGPQEPAAPTPEPEATVAPDEAPDPATAAMLAELEAQAQEARP